MDPATDDSCDLADEQLAIISKWYSRLKELDMDGSRKFEQKVISDDETEQFERAKNVYINDSAAMVESLAVQFSIDAKIFLEYLIDPIFRNEVSPVNFGRLLKDYGLSVPLISKIKTFALSNPEESIEILFDNYILFPCEAQVVMATIYSRMSEEQLNFQFNSHNVETVYDIDTCELDEVTKEAIRLLEGDDDEEDIIQKFDKAEEECNKLDALFKEVNDTCNEVNSIIEACGKTRFDFNITAMNFLSQSPTIPTQENFVSLEDDENDIDVLSVQEKDESSEPLSMEHLVPPLPYNQNIAEISTQQLSAKLSDEIEHVGRVCHNLNLKSKQPADVKLEFSVGDKCLALIDGNLWQYGFVVKILPDGVEITSTINHVSNFYTISKSKIAFDFVVDWLLPVGSRIVAKFKKTHANNYSGWVTAVVGEPPSLSQRAVVRLKTGQCVDVLFEGVFFKTRVLKVDAMLALVQFDEEHLEWLYRGNRRLEPIHSRNVNVQGVERGHRPLRTFNRSSHAPVVEFVSAEDNVPLKAPLNQHKSPSTGDDLNAASQSVKKETQTARKSTSKQINSHQDQAVLTKSHSAENLPRKQPVTLLDDKDIIEETLDVELSVKPLFSMHEKCSSDCLLLFGNDDPATYKGKNPLVIPLYVGWNRITLKACRRLYILYETPCGKRLTTMKQIAEYLNDTDSRLSVDYFCLESKLRPFSRMNLKIESKFHLKDFSGGNENTPIECINSVNDETPPTLSYQSIRYTTDNNVNLNLASEFLCGCDCEDDCSNRLECACQLLTIEAGRKGKQTLVEAAKKFCYDFRRLPQGQVSSGIYECNDLCKCKKSCVNRVVQNPLTCCLQLFKTLECGWGIRTLYDIPKGAFICVYAGNVLSDDKANEVGKTQGDEYLADLDFVHNFELKEGYEAEAYHSDSSTDSGDSLDMKKIKLVEDVIDETDSLRMQTSLSSIKPNEKKFRLRDYIQDKDILILDAKVSGNVGRYLNHSCSPNVFVQNVFVDTHMLTLPWVAFFASELIKAGTELRWDYSYVPDSVPGKIIKCKCRSEHCRGRLL
uniref:Histone-lysine N-methyltransferase eggless n=1 Tax=Romanomermis culicivorax TaxID=13658 RepID=A0A915KYP3_ROMCU